MRRLLLLAVLATAAHAQFQLLSVSGNAEVQVPAVFDFGPVTSGDTDTVQFRVRNTSNAPASLYSMALAGSGFTLQGSLGLPRTIAPQAAFDFTIRFQADAAGSYSAGLTLPGISTILTATVVPALLYSVGATVNFGTVERGTSATIHVSISNHSNQQLFIPPLVVHGTGFSLNGAPPSGTRLDPQQSTNFDLIFSPAATGSYSGSLSAGDRTFTLVGAGQDPPPPTPILSVDWPRPTQGTLRITFDAPSKLTIGATVSLDFQGLDDPAVAFAAGGRSFSFQIAAGQTPNTSVPFQAGTTAGNLIFTVTIAGVVTSQTFAITPAAVTISTAQASRSTNSLTVQLTGFDNTRTAGPLAFTFYDRAGNAIPPSPIQATADFPAFFQTSGLGGLFQLQAAFPVNGDATQIAAFEVKLTNAAGITTTARTSF